MYPTEFLDASELKIRKYWLRVLLIFAAIGVCTGFFDLAAASSDGPRSTLAILGSFSKSIFTAVTACASYYMLYHCSYKHPGTKYLTFSIPFMFFSAFYELYECIFSPESSFNNAIVWGFLATICVLSVGWAALSVRLRKINKKVQHRLLYGSQEYATTCVAFQEAKDCSELDSRFQQAVQNRSKMFISIVKRLYKQRKSQLNLTQ